MSTVLIFIYVLLFIPIDNKLLQIITYINPKHIRVKLSLYYMIWYVPVDLWSFNMYLFICVI